MSVEHAIFVLKENASFSDGEIEDATDMAIEALEKQIPKKTIYGGIGCSECGNDLAGHMNEDEIPVTFDYCPWCGQKVDWS